MGGECAPLLSPPHPKKSNRQTKKPINRFLLDGPSAGIRYLQTSIEIKRQRMNFSRKDPGYNHKHVRDPVPSNFDTCKNLVCNISCITKMITNPLLSTIGITELPLVTMQLQKNICSDFKDLPKRILEGHRECLHTNQLSEPYRSDP